MCVARSSCQYNTCFSSVRTLGNPQDFQDTQELSLHSYLKTIYTVSSLEMHAISLKSDKLLENWMAVEKTETQEEKPNIASFHKQLKEWSLVYRSVSLKISSYLSYLKVTSLLQIFWCFNLWGFFLAGTLWKYCLLPLGSHLSLFMQLAGTPVHLRLLLVYLFEVNQHIKYLLEEWQRLHH